jgi:hypothetical protein
MDLQEGRMRKIISGSAILAMMSGSTASLAAEDMGMRYGPGLRQQERHGGLGAQASIRIRLGDERTVRESERLALGIAAGPVLDARDTRTVMGKRTTIAGLASFSFRPGHSATVKLIGQPVAAQYRDSGTRESTDQSRRQNMSTLGKVGIGVGVVVVAVLVAGVIAVRSSNWDD